MKNTLLFAILAFSQTLAFAPPKPDGKKNHYAGLAGLSGAFAAPSAATSRRIPRSTPISAESSAPVAAGAGPTSASAAPAPTSPEAEGKEAEDPTPTLRQLRSNADRLTVPNPSNPFVDIRIIPDAAKKIIDNVLEGKGFSEDEFVGCVGASCNLAIPFLETIIGDAYWGIGATALNKPMILIAFMFIHHALTLAVKKANLPAGSAISTTAAIQLRMIALTIEDYKKELREKNPAEAEGIIRAASFK